NFNYLPPNHNFLRGLSQRRGLFIHEQHNTLSECNKYFFDPLVVFSSPARLLICAPIPLKTFV
uniref:Uncharacterized protein n=1 Tax=Calidris pygmaea TaxID=425635 RepID=A0A8C3JHM4_9CHAR